MAEHEIEYRGTCPSCSGEVTATLTKQRNIVGPLDFVVLHDCVPLGAERPAVAVRVQTEVGPAGQGVYSGPESPPQGPIPTPRGSRHLHRRDHHRH